MPTYPTPFGERLQPQVTLVELRMRQLSGRIREKPNWWEKVHRPEIVAKWREEMKEQDRAAVDALWGGEARFEHGAYEPGSPPKLWPREPVNDAQLDYVFDELKFDAEERYDKESGIYPAAVPSVYESRSLVPMGVKTALLEDASSLENLPENELDWHPGSNNQVLNLIHPSLFCLRIGRSRVRAANESGEEPAHVLDLTEYRRRRPDLETFLEWKSYAVSDHFQWLPTDFEVSDSGEVQALGYVHNLDVRQAPTLSSTLSAILMRFIPLFEKTLSDVLRPDIPAAVQVDPYTWYDSPEANDPEGGPMPEDDTDEWHEWTDRYQWPVIPDPAPFKPPPTEDRVNVTLCGRTLQVITKMANIVLTPASPRYPGGAWHIEGMANERIVATGIYYYSAHNITASRLAFRGVVGWDDDFVSVPYQQGDSKGYRVAFGYGRDEALSQELGRIVAEEDKCVVFPNLLQHRVEPFELADATKPGHRKILCFFLVDPETRILSTTDVPEDDAARVSRAQAEEDRAALMAERTRFVDAHNENVFEVPFNMCEH